jgi:hypothetical protein
MIFRILLYQFVPLNKNIIIHLQIYDFVSTDYAHFLSLFYIIIIFNTNNKLK